MAITSKTSKSDKLAILSRLAKVPGKKYSSLYLTSLAKQLFPELREMNDILLEVIIAGMLPSRFEETTPAPAKEDDDSAVIWERKNIRDNDDMEYCE